MRVLTNPGANLPRELVERYRICITSSNIVVDGAQYDCREDIPLDMVDTWVSFAREYPFVLGTSAAELARQYIEIGAEDREILVVMSSRKIIQSYDAACSAARTIEGHPLGRTLGIRVVDGMSTDLGLGLLTLAAAEAARAGMGLEPTAAMVEALALRSRFAFIPRTLDNLVRGGRASFLRSFMAKMLGVRPILAFVDGEAQMVGRCGAKDDYAEVLASWLREQIRSDAVWIGVGHGGRPDEAQRLADALRERFAVAYALVRPVSPPVYLHAGPGALGAVVMPLEGLPWTPPAPAR
jgi:DegV family protein with EDD domain